MAFFVYILQSVKLGRYYIGQTQNIEQRLERHNSCRELSTAPYAPWEVKCIIKKDTRIEAMILERKLKNLNRERILIFIEKYKTGG